MGVKLDEPDVTEMSVDELLDALGIGGDSADQNDITVLRHVRPIAQRRAAAMIADHIQCADFNRFKPLFERIASDLKTGMRKTMRFGGNTSVATGDFFIVGGQLAYVAEVGGLLKSPTGESDARLRVIYANGTESNLLRRSLQRSLYKDDRGRRISCPAHACGQNNRSTIHAHELSSTLADDPGEIMKTCMQIRMKPSDSAHGWLLRLMELGCKATYNNGPFGRTNWVVKNGAEVIQVTQGKSTSLTTKIANPTSNQREIARCLVASGIAIII